MKAVVPWPLGEADLLRGGAGDCAICDLAFRFPVQLFRAGHPGASTVRVLFADCLRRCPRCPARRTDEKNMRWMLAPAVVLGFLLITLYLGIRAASGRQRSVSEHVVAGRGLPLA